MVTARWSVANRTGTSTLKPAVTSTPTAGAAPKVTSPVVVSSDQPATCSMPHLGHAAGRVVLDQLELRLHAVAGPEQLAGGLVVGPILTWACRCQAVFFHFFHRDPSIHLAGTRSFFWVWLNSSVPRTRSAEWTGEQFDPWHNGGRGPVGARPSRWRRRGRGRSDGRLLGGEEIAADRRLLECSSLGVRVTRVACTSPSPGAFADALRSRTCAR